MNDNTPIPFEQEFPVAGATLAMLYRTKKARYFAARWLHFFTNGTYNNIPCGRYF